MKINNRERQQQQQQNIKQRPQPTITTSPTTTFMTTTPSPPPSTVPGARLGRKQPQNTPEGWTKLTRRESHSSSPAPGRVSGLSALSILDGPWKPNQRALPGGSAMELLPQRALPRKRSTLASPGHWMSPPARPTARSSPTHLPDSGIRSGYRHRAS